MDKIIKNILVKIENAGFKAYLVGGYVRDYLIGINSYDIDICTSALPKELHKLFPSNSNSNTYGGFNLKIGKYNIDITTFRKELNYNGRKPVEILYIDNLEEDIQRRDFTINTVCMDKSEKIIDLVNGVQDICSKTIKMIDNIDKRLEEDPLRILRAVRFASVLDFNLEEELYQKIKEKSYLVTSLSDIRIKEELNKILLNKNFLKGLNLLKELNILNYLKIDFDKIVYVNDLCGMWSQLTFIKNYAFTKQELKNIINIRQIINEGTIDNYVLYKYGLYNSLVAAEILSINKKQVHKLMNKLPIKSIKELQITSEEIIKLMQITPSNKVTDIKNEMINLILNNKLKNKKNDLVKYILMRKDD